MSYRKGNRIVGYTPSFFPFQALFQLVMLPIRLINWLFYRTRVTGRENLRRCGSAILVSNHTMLLDPAVVAHAFGFRPDLLHHAGGDGAHPVPRHVRAASGSASDPRRLGLSHLAGKRGAHRAFPVGPPSLFPRRGMLSVEPGHPAFPPGRIPPCLPPRHTGDPDDHRPSREEVARPHPRPRPGKDGARSACCHGDHWQARRPSGGRVVTGRGAGRTLQRLRVSRICTR